MSSETLNKRLEQIKLLLAAYAGASLVLLLLTLGDMPLNNLRFQQDQVQTIDAWFGLWIVLQIGTPVPGILLLVSRSWREVEVQQRHKLAFGFFLVAWLLLLAFDLRNTILVGNIMHLVTIVCGAILALGYFVSRRAQPTSEEIFP